MGQEEKTSSLALMTPAQIVADPLEFTRWWQTRRPANRDQAIKKAALEAGLIFTGGMLIWLTEKGRVHQARARPSRPSFTCPLCQRVSHNPNDVRHRFCAVCGHVDDVIEKRRYGL